MYERLTKRVQGRRDEGFTLIELLIVIVILGILAAIVVFAIGQTRGDSVASSCKTNFKSIELSAEAVKTKTGKVPARAAFTAATEDAAFATQTAANTAFAELVQTSTSTNGALLKSYPISADYRLVYESVAAPTTTTTYTLTVKKGDGSAITAATGRSATDTTGCDGL